MRRSHSRGFTLIELMVTLAVVVILALLAIPSFRDLIDKSRLRGATDDVVNILNTARGSAVKLQKDVNVSAVAGSSGSWCVGADAAADPGSVGDPIPAATACDCTSTSPTCVIGGKASLVSSSNYSGTTISIVDSNFATSAGGIVFNSKFGGLDLSAVPTTALITVTSPSSKYKTSVTVSALGQVHVCVPSGSPFVSGYPSC